MKDKIKVAIRHNFHFGFGKTLEEAISEFNKASKTRFKKDMEVTVFLGEKADEVYINHMGDLISPVGTKVISINQIKI